jgi:hypothetical protein
VFSVGWEDSPKSLIEPGPLGREIVLGETPDLTAATDNRVEQTQTTPKMTSIAT